MGERTGQGFLLYFGETAWEKTGYCGGFGIFNGKCDSTGKGYRLSGNEDFTVAFDSREESDYLPHNYVRNSVCYTGTHDNDTTSHWFSALNEHDRDFAKRYMNLTDESMACGELIRLAFASVADTCIIPLQDYLELGEEARINIPSTLGMNWKWRLLGEELTESLAERIQKLTRLYGR